MQRAHVLIIEDEVGIAESLGYILHREFFATTHAKSIAEGEKALRGEPVDVLVLDLMLPDGNGLELLRRMRAAGDQRPVIVLTSRDAEIDRVLGLELGADDYVVKPFSLRELAARVRAVLRRTRPDTGSHAGGDAAEPAAAAAATTSVGGAGAAAAAAEESQVLRLATGLVLDLGKRRATVGATELSLTKTEFDILVVLGARPGQVFPRDTLLDRVWGDDVVVTDRTVDSHVKGLRHKLREAGAEDLIETVRGVGYRMRE